MVSPNVNKIYQETKNLTEAERDELRKLLDLRRAGQTRSLQNTEHPHTESADEERRKHRRTHFQPIEMPGGPLSDDIIRDRR